jgi:predicted Zn finger-like uncharacterized protein
MQIVCPECKFAREVDESKIPARSQVATCPKCQTKFKFRELPEQDFLIEESAAPKQESKPEPVAEAKPEPTPEQEPVLKPFVQKVPARPETAPKPEPEAEEPTFPGIPGPAADDDGGLWDRLHTMTPPEAKPEDDATPRAETERKPPVIGARYGQPEDQSRDNEPVSGWTGEFNSDFPDPMDFQDEEDETMEEDGHTVQVPPPFEQLDRYGFFSGLFLTVKLVLFSPRLFFSVMPVGNGVSKPLTFAILMALIQTVAQFAWGMAGLTPGMEVTAGGVTPVDYNVTNGMFELLLTPAFAAITLYLFTGFYHVILSMLKAGDRGFEGSFRALAYAYAPMITGIIPMPTMEVMAGWMLLYAAWSLVLTAIGFKHIHKTSYLKTIPVLLMPLLVGMILALLMIQGQMPTV